MAKTTHETIAAGTPLPACVKITVTVELADGSVIRMEALGPEKVTLEDHASLVPSPDTLSGRAIAVTDHSVTIRPSVGRALTVQQFEP